MPPGQTAPDPGTCRLGDYNANRSECISTGAQAMPPSSMSNTDPNVDFDTKGRAYRLTLPFSPWWTNHLHPGAAIGISYSDDLGRTWVTGNDGAYLDHIPGNRYQDHVYAAWAVFNGSAIKVRMPSPATATAGRPSPSRSP